MFHKNVSCNIWASIWKAIIFETVEFEHFYFTWVEAEIKDATTLVLYTVIMYNCNYKNSLFLFQYVG